MNANPHPLYDELLLRAYERHLRAQARAPATISRYLIYGRHFLRLFRAWDAHPLSINTADLDVWLNTFTTPSTRHAAYTATISLTDFISAWHGIPITPLRRTHRAWRSTYTAPYSPEEIAALCQVGSVAERIRGYLTLAHHVPAGHLNGLSSADVTPDGTRIQVRHRFIEINQYAQALALTSNWRVTGGADAMSAWLKRACQVTGVPYRHWRRIPLPDTTPVAMSRS